MAKRRFQKFEKASDYSSSDSDTEKRDVPGPSLRKHFMEPQSEEATFGPLLPPHFAQEFPDSPPPQTELNIDKDTFMPALPPHFEREKTRQSRDFVPKGFGPTLPNSVEQSGQQSIGPALPSHLQHLEENFFGPELPPEFQQNTTAKICLGPALPPGFVPPDNLSSEDDESYGPDPRLMASATAGNHNDVDYRAEMARRKMNLKETKKLERETWMLDLPPERAANLGLGPRQFRAKPAPEMGDRTVWTDTPREKAQKQGLPPKVNDKDIVRKQLIDERDREMEKMARKAERKLKREESLLDSHTKKLKKEAKDGTTNNAETGERKRFNREEDMQVNRFDDAQKKAIFKKAQHLNDRFSQGESKFL